MKQSWGLLNLPLALFVPLLGFLCMSHLISLMWLEDVNSSSSVPYTAYYWPPCQNHGRFMVHRKVSTLQGMLKSIAA